MARPETAQYQTARPGIDLDTLRLVVLLADHGDLTVVGKRLGLGKRTATARIAQAERRIGARLFDHARKPIAMTAAGEAFVAEARQALAAIERAERFARDIAAAPNRLAISVTASALFGPVRDLLAAPALAEAGLALEPLEMRSDEQLAALANGRVVMAFVTPPLAALPRLEHRIVARSHWVACMPDEETRLRKTASLSGLARKPLVMIARDQAPLVHDGLIGALTATGVVPKVSIEAHQWPSIMALVALGFGSALVPSMVARNVAVAGATVLPLSDGQGLAPWPIACAWLPAPVGSQAAEAIDIMKRALPAV